MLLQSRTYSICAMIMQHASLVSCIISIGPPDSLQQPCWSGGNNCLLAKQVATETLCLPVAKHESKGGDDQGCNQSPDSSSPVDVPKAADSSNVACLHAKALAHQWPSPCPHCIERQLHPDPYQISQPVATLSQVTNDLSDCKARLFVMRCHMH